MSEKVKDVQVSCTVAGYIPGMEADPEFIGVMFRRKLDLSLAEDIKAKNSARGNLIAEKCKAYGVKPLGAVSAPASGPNKKEQAMVLALAELTNDIGKIIKVMAKKTGKTFTAEEIMAITG